MLGKLNELRKTMEEIKSRLDTISVDGEAGAGAVKVVMNGNRKLLSISIDEKLLNAAAKEELQDYIEIAVNLASEKAQKVSESEMKAAGTGLLPNLPGLF